MAANFRVLWRLFCLQCEEHGRHWAGRESGEHKTQACFQVVGAGEQGSSSEDLLQLQNLLDQHRDELGSSVKAVEQVDSFPKRQSCWHNVKPQAMDEVEANKLWMEEHFDAVREWLMTTSTD